MKIEDLCKEHPYYCNDTNYLSNEATLEYDNWQEYFEEWGDADEDYNLIFRWDIEKREEESEYPIGSYVMSIFYVQQRKGHFAPVIINEVKDEDADQIYEFLKKAHSYMQKLWEPFGNENPEKHS